MTVTNDFNRKHIALRIAHMTTPRAWDVLTLIVDAVSAADDEEEDAVLDDTAIGNLCRAYSLACKKECELLALPEESLQGEEAEKFFRAVAHKAYCLELPDTPPESEDVPTLPVSIPRDIPIPTELLMELGKVIGFREGVRAKIFGNYCEYYTVDGVM